ncbi:MAG: MFS transporter [Terrimesophilobacter sp.]
MWLRRVFFYAQFWMIPVLPLWLLIVRGMSIVGSGWDLMVLLFAAPLLSLALIVVMGLTMARKAVRRARMLSWIDVGILGALYLSVMVAGLYSLPIFAVLAISLAIVAFWSAVWQWVTETRQHVTLAFASYGAIPATFR